MYDRRYVTAATELRLEKRDDKPVIVGHTAVFNVLSCDLGGFREKLAPGCFANALAQDQDPRALLNHDRNRILGRRSAGTLTLQEDAHGLRMEIFPPDNSYARDLITSIERGDVTGCSFAFNCAQDGDAWDTREDGSMERTVTNVSKLWDVGPVTHPAYDQTTLGIRSLFGAGGLDLPGIAPVLLRAQHGLELRAQDVDLLHATIAKLNGLVPVHATPRLTAAMEQLEAIAP